MDIKIVGNIPFANRMNKNTLYLVRDNWDDFGYKTMFNSWLLIDGVAEELGSLHLSNINYDLNGGQNRNTVDEEVLNDINQKDYISLGSLSYYEHLATLDKELRIEVLKQLQDLAYDLKLFDDFKDTNVVRTSFLRGIKAYEVRTRYNRLANGIYSIKFEIEINKKRNTDFELTLKVDTTSILPTNIHTLIGSNGSGKTFTLQNVADACSGYLVEEDITMSTSLNGDFTAMITSSDDRSYHVDRPIEGIIYMSYSPFDSHKSMIQNEEVSFIGLNGTAIQSKNLDKLTLNRQLRNLLKKDVISEGEIEKRTILGSQEKISMWNSVVKGLSFDSYLNEIKEDLLIDIDNPSNGVSRKTIKRLSSGQKIILLSFANIINDAVERTLVIIDEPELFLHPPLITAYVRELSKILKKTNSLCLVSTHSPFIVQELPKECVHILSRKFDEASISTPQSETFGENIASINNLIFGTDMRLTGYFRYLNELAEKEPETAADLLENRKLGIDAELVLRSALMQGDDDYWLE